MSVSVQEMVRPSEAVDLYYYDAETSKKQAFATTQNTKYVQQFANLTGVALPAKCLALKSAQFQVQQVMFNNQGDALARRVDLATKAYAFPCEFVQQESLINLQNTLAPQNVVLTGFRSGEVKSIEIWLTDNDDTLSNGPTFGSLTGYNPNTWYPPASVEMLYAGDIYARYDNGVGQLFNLINSNKSPAFDTVEATTNSSTGVVNAAPQLSQWLSLPFAQTLVDEDAHYILVHGKPITNGIINLNNLVIPYQSTSGWTMHVSYVYNTTLLFSQGTCDYVF